MLGIAVGTFDSIRTFSIVVMLFSTLVAFRFVGTIDCFVTELLTAKASIDSGQWLLGNGWISYAVDRDVRTLENLLNIVIRFLPLEQSTDAVERSKVS